MPTKRIAGPMFLRGVTLILTLLLISCAQPGDPGDTGGDPDPVPLAVSACMPAPGSVDVAVGSQFTVTFNKDLDSSSLTGCISVMTGATSVDVSCSVPSGTPKTLIIVPDAPLQADTGYTVTIDSALTALDGATMDAAYSFSFTTKAEGPVPSLTVRRESDIWGSMASGTWVNEGVTIQVTSPASEPGGTLSIQWSVDGEAWNETTASEGSTFLTYTVDAVDGKEIEIRGGYLYNTEQNYSAIKSYVFDLTAPELVAVVEPEPGRLVMTFSEEIYARDDYPDSPTEDDFSFDSQYFSDMEFTVESLSVDGTEVTVVYSYVESEGDPLQVSINATDRAGNQGPYAADTGIVLLDDPTAVLRSSSASGTITFTGIEGSDEATEVLVSCATSDTWNEASQQQAAVGEEITFSGLDPETRYYIKAKALMPGVGSSRASGYAYTPYIYPVPLFNEGSGTEADPWIIDTRAELEVMLDAEAMRDDYFVLDTDIDLSRYPWTVLGGYPDYGVFSGDFDGAGYCLSGAVLQSIDNTKGLFRYIEDATIKNLLLDGFTGGGLAVSARGASVIDRVAVTNLYIDGGQDKAGLIGTTAASDYPYDGTVLSITRCFVQGIFDNLRTYRNGGLVGQLEMGTQIEDCFAAVDFNGAESRLTGGFIGTMEGDSLVQRCFSSGNVDTDDEGAGFIGSVEKGWAETVPVLRDSICMAPEVGHDGLEPSYAERFRLFHCYIHEDPVNYVNASNNYAWSGMLVDGVAVTDGNLRDGTGLSLAAFKNAAGGCYSAWDFVATWIMTADGPMLRDMPLGGGTFGTPAVDPVAWD